MKVLITGATGFIGKAICEALARQGHELLVLARNTAQAKATIPAPHTGIQWNFSDPLDGPSLKKLSGLSAVINLAGEPLFGRRWNAEYKEKLVDSRVGNTRKLIEMLQDTGNIPRVFVSGSAVGIYGDRGDEVLDETSSPGTDFLATICQDWEGALFQSALEKTRKVALRIGIVLGKGGGALDELLLPFSLGLGGPLASGSQWMSWIHLDDLVGIVLKALNDDSLSGPINCTAPHPVTNQDFTRSLARALSTVGWVRVPKFALRLGLGEAAAALLASQRVSPAKLIRSGHSFSFPDLDLALNHILGESYSLGFAELVRRCWVPQPINEVFTFFSDAANLEKITPPWLNFKVLRQSTSVLQEGTHIDYRLSLHGIGLGWRTEISTWDPPRSFADVQLKGPYHTWRHTHRFSQLAGGTLMEDQVLYRLPLGRLGRAIAGNYVKKDVSKIFSYRNEKIYEFLNSGPTQRGT